MAGRHHRFRATTFVLIGSGGRARIFLMVAREFCTVRCDPRLRGRTLGMYDFTEQQNVPGAERRA